jgi:hypothetical protein
LFEEQRQIALDLKEQRAQMQEQYKEAEKTKQPIQQKIKYVFPLPSMVFIYLFIFYTENVRQSANQ